MPRRGLFIDLDGTLADSLPVMRTVYGRFLASQGKSGSDAEFARLNGPPLSEIVADLARTHAIDRPVAALLDVYWTLIDAVYREVRPRPGAAELLRTARAHGIPVAVVTSSASRLTRAWLQAVDLNDLVDTVVGGDEVDRGKPDPEPYRIALQRTGCDAQASLAVEDSVAGARSAIAAGIPTLLLGDSSVEAPPTTVIVNGLDRVAAILLGKAR